MSHSIHRVCVDCWIEYFPDDGDPHKLSQSITPGSEPCCFCGCEIHNLSGSGAIYVRYDPTDPILHCGGRHDD